MNEATQVEVEETTGLEALEGSESLHAVEKAAISEQIATAQANPRSVTRALNEARSLATLDEETAASCFYSLPRKGKRIEGGSARLAEIMVYAWGNLRADADIVEIGKTHVTAVGTCLDLEKNVGLRVRVKRRITDRHGKRYNEDMIGVTSNAAISIALRNAVFKVIPKAFWKRIYEEARQASLGKGGTLTQKRQKALDWFGKLGVTPEQIYEQLGVDGLDDLKEDELITLRGMVTAIQEGDATVEEMFRPPDHSEGTDELNEALVGDDQDDEPAPDVDASDEAGGDTPKERFQALCEDEGIPEDKARSALAMFRKKSTSDLTSKDYSDAADNWVVFVDDYRELEAEVEGDGNGDLPL